LNRTRRLCYDHPPARSAFRYFSGVSIRAVHFFPEGAAMTAKRFFLPLVLAGALLAVAGCDDKKPDQPKVDATPKTPAVNDMKAGMDKTADQAKTAAGNSADATKAAAAKTADATKAAAANTADATKAAAANTADATKAGASTAGDAAAAAKTQAGDWMAKLEDAITKNKLEDAKTYLDKLEAMRASLPAEWQTKLDSLKIAYDAKAKAAIPGLNK
jgi:hypothetical protein